MSAETYEVRLGKTAADFTALIPLEFRKFELRERAGFVATIGV